MRGYKRILEQVRSWSNEQILQRWSNPDRVIAGKRKGFVTRSDLKVLDAILEVSSERKLQLPVS